MEDKKEWVSTSELYKLMSEEQRKEFTERLRISPEIALDCFQNPSMLKQFTQEDREAIYSKKRTKSKYVVNGKTSRGI
mgnify:CR=1 FL=1